MQDMRELYGAAAVRELDRRAIHDHGIAGYALMQRAAAAAWSALQRRWPQARRLLVIAGAGNNGGDGYEIARLARAAGCAVEVCHVGPPSGGDAGTARAAWRTDGGRVIDAADATRRALGQAEVIVDALYGSGLSRAPSGLAEALIEAINQARQRGAGVLAVDLPSGVLADTGATPGVAVRADVTVTFIGDKLGLHTAAGADCAGRVQFEPLDLPASVYVNVPVLARRLWPADAAAALPPRSRGAHKGDHGHVLIVGGDHGMAGAALLAARAALRCGAGLVSVATRERHAAALTAAQPELMVHAVEQGVALAPLLARADVVVVGPGLGQGEWGRALWAALADVPRRVVDADALNLLSHQPQRRDDWILTPHPGEAARLLGLGTADVQADRLQALRALAVRYGGVPLLKGVGTLVWQPDGAALCPYGNPGMGSGGMGDVLSGVIAALWAQGRDAVRAAAIGVLVHARAGDAAAATAPRGLLPSDVIDALRAQVNPTQVLPHRG